MSQIASNSTVSSTACQGKQQRKHQCFALLALCEGNPPAIGRFPSQRDSDAESISMQWHHHEMLQETSLSRYNLYTDNTPDTHSRGQHIYIRQCIINRDHLVSNHHLGCLMIQFIAYMRHQSVCISTRYWVGSWLRFQQRHHHEMLQETSLSRYNLYTDNTMGHTQ